MILPLILHTAAETIVDSLPQQKVALFAYFDQTDVTRSFDQEELILYKFINEQQAELRAERQQITEQRDYLEREASLLTEEKRDSLLAELQQKAEIYNRKQRNYDQVRDKAVARYTQYLQECIRTAVKQIQKERGITYVLYECCPGDDALNITQDLIARILVNKQEKAIEPMDFLQMLLQ